VPEANLLDVAHAASPYEDVVSVGLFKPTDERMPQWSLVAVTEANVHIFAVQAVVPYVTVSNPRLVASLDRGTTVVRTTETTLVLTDVHTGRAFRFERSTGQGECVINELQRAPSGGA